MKDIITTQEATRLKGLEKTIAKGIATVWKVAEALTEIKESRLYRAKYKTFEEYCAAKWNFTKRRAYQLIEAGETRDSLPENVKQSFPNAKQLNALAKIPKEGRAEAAKVIIDSVKQSGQKLTAAVIEAHSARPISPIKGIDMSKVENGEPPSVPEMTDGPSFGAPMICMSHATTPSTMSPKQISGTSDAKMTPAQCQKEVAAIQARIKAVCNIPAEHQKYGVIFNAAANIEMNWQAGRKEYSPYTS